MAHGSCLCGAVTFEVRGELNSPDACHCVNCRKHSGHFFASTDVYRSDIKVSGADNIKCFRSSEKVQRGFCGTCGSTLFWAPIYMDWIAVAIGAFDFPPGTKLGRHLFESETGEYYDDYYVAEPESKLEPKRERAPDYGFNFDIAKRLPDMEL